MDSGKIRFTIQAVNEYRKTGVWNAAKHGPPPATKEKLNSIVLGMFPARPNTHASLSKGRRKAKRSTRKNRK